MRAGAHSFDSPRKSFAGAALIIDSGAKRSLLGAMPPRFGPGFVLAALTFGLAGGVVAGCQQQAIEENQRQVEATQAQIEQMQKEIAALNGQQTYGANAPAPGTPGTCDKGVMQSATRRGRDAFASGDLKRALGYYQDAITACPEDPGAELNVARTYEAMGDRTQAIEHYRVAANAKDSSSSAAQDARVALSRLKVSP